MTVLAAALAVFVVTFAVPLAVYGAAAHVLDLTTPTELSPGGFLATVALEKAGVAAAFTGILAVGGDELRDAWIAYAALWVAMYAVTEATEVVRRRQGVGEAVAGVVSEALYFPAAALVATAVLG